ncbi:redoxin domain-containing protein [Gelidibacter sp.]|uniref:TlpA family protein disulfide reductase n=1 Tax=Gelidibacter sp. TaxID=2018083 RepID=UPI003264CEBE
MKKISLYLFLMLLALYSCKQEAQKKAEPLTIGHLTISNEHPKPGDQLELTYKSDQEVEAFYAYMVGDKNYPLDIDFSAKDGEQKSSIKIPDSAVALAFIFKVDDQYDNNNKKGYLLPLYTKNGEKIPGSSSAIAYYPIRYGENYGIKGDPTTALNTIKFELDAHPNLKSTWEVPYLQLAYKNDKEEAKKLIDQYAASLGKKPTVSEKEYTSLLQFYSMMGEEAKVDSIKSMTLAKFPKGTTANYELIDQFQQESDLEKKAEIFKKYSEANAKSGNLGDYMAGTLARNYYQQKDMANFDKYLSQVDDKARRASTLNNLAWPLAESGENLDEAEKMSKTSLELITDLQKNQDDKPEFYTKKQYDKSLKSSYNMFADTYAFILFQQGKIKEAIAYQEKAHDHKGRDTEANQRYIEYLIADNQFETVKDKAESFIKSGHANEKIKEAYRTTYLKLNPSATDVEENMITFEKEAYATQVAEIEKTILDEEAPTFTLKDMKGKDVSLASLKGKTVILDFWATWCGPCKASFPGMQEVVTKYKNDDKVVLLFVDTFERGPNREKLVEDFIKTSKYDFHVVYDTELEGSNAFEVAEKYDITGIPTKVIIGPDGRMKFKSVGYSGSNEKLVKEIDIMIDILKS